MTQPRSREELEALLPFCETDRQREQLQLMMTHGSTRKAAAAAGLHHRSFHNLIQSLIVRAARKGWSPAHDMTHALPDGQRLRGVSTLYDEHGKLRLQWVKSTIDHEREAELLKAMVDGFTESIRGTSRTAPAPKGTRADLVTVYPMGDPHVGMYAWADEAGDDFDTDIAAQDIAGAIERLVVSAPPCDTAHIINLGDFFHTDSPANRTAKSGHALDVDTRWQKVLRVGFQIMRHCVEVALTRHKNVRVINAIGNHDEQSSSMLSIAMAALYERNRRVQVDMSPAPFRYFEFGKNLCGVAHGDMVKPMDLGAIMAHDQAEAWGRTRHRYWFTGHVHHKRVFELPGCLVESFRTLAARDAWHSASGYRSGRDMQSIILHREHGEVERHRVDIGMIRAA